MGEVGWLSIALIGIYPCADPLNDYRGSLRRTVYNHTTRPSRGPSTFLSTSYGSIEASMVEKEKIISLQSGPWLWEL